MAEHDTVIYTIGHSNHPFDKLAALLRKHSIQVLVDVRSRPHSRWVSWTNQKNLETEIPKLGIEYRWAGDCLGGLPSDPNLQKRNPQRKKKTDPAIIADYDKIAKQQWFKDAINELLEVASHKQTAIMCSEENPQNCHRSQLVGRTLVKKGVKVLNIRGNGIAEPQSAELKR